MIFVTAALGPGGNSDGLLGASRIPDKGNPLMIDPTFTSGFDGLAQVRRALDSVPGVLAVCDSGDQETDTNSRGAHSLNQKTMTICAACSLKHLYCSTSTIVHSSATLETRKFNIYRISEMLFF